jgi:hypothetical protein
MSPAPRPVPLTIRFRGGLRRLRSADNRLSGAFTDLRSALRWASGEIASHRGYALTVGVPFEQSEQDQQSADALARIAHASTRKL